MKKEFWVWVPDDSDEKDATLVMDVHDAEDAAKEFVEVHHSDFDYASEVEVKVKDPDGNVTEWVVTAEETVIFHASRKSA